MANDWQPVIIGDYFRPTAKRRPDHYPKRIYSLSTEALRMPPKIAQFRGIPVTAPSQLRSVVERYRSVLRHISRSAMVDRIAGDAASAQRCPQGTEDPIPSESRPGSAARGDPTMPKARFPAGVGKMHPEQMHGRSK
jgi:hypothetical protein